MKKSKKAALLALTFAAAFCCSTSVLAYAADTGEMTSAQESLNLVESNDIFDELKALFDAGMSRSADAARSIEKSATSSDGSFSLGTAPKDPYTDPPKDPYTDPPKDPYTDPPKDPYTDPPKDPYTDPPIETEDHESPKEPDSDPPIEPEDHESPKEPDLPVYPMERVEFPPEEPEVPVEPVTPAEPEPQPEPAPQPEPEPQPQPEPEPAPQPEPAPTLPQTSQLWWPVGLVFILGFAMVLAGLVEMRKSRRHEDSDR